jgi:hypothetical protein
MQGVLMIPGVAAVILGLLYTTGALLKTAQLRGAGVSVTDALPLVPLQQLLSLGIGTLVHTFWTALITLGVFGVFAFALRRRPIDHLPGIVMPRRRPRRVAPTPSWLRRHALNVIVYSGAFFLYGIDASPLSSLRLTISSISGGLVADEMAGQRRRSRVFTVVAVTYLSGVTLNIADNYVTPTPLPLTTVRTDQGLYAGELVVAADTWQIAVLNMTMRSVPSTGIQEAVICSRERPEPRTVWQFLTGTEPEPEERRVRGCPLLG